MNKTILFNDGWEFAKSSLEVVDKAELNFRPIDIPHDWLIYNTLDLYENSIGWHRRNFNYAKESGQVLLYFDGVYMDSTLYVNGKYVGEWKYGYSAFEHEITEALVEGANEILVKVVYQSPNSRWYSGAGIYRNVWLKTRGKTHIVTDGIYVTTSQTDMGWEIEIDTELSLHDNLELTHSILYQDKVVAFGREKLKMDENSHLINRQKLFVKAPLLWSPEEPNLYQLRTKLQIDDLVIESISQNLGFKNVVLDPKRGFILNGTKMKLNGVCEHHDLGALGAAFNKSALARRFKILKDMCEVQV